MTTLLGYLSGLPKELIVVVIAALPLIELRGAIPVGMLLLGIPPWETFILAMIGNMLPIPLILWLLPPIRRIATDWPLLGPFLRWVDKRVDKRKGEVERAGFWGLVAFVGVPLPGTGAWTGAAIAIVLKMRFWSALLANALGVLVAGVLIAALSALGVMAIK